MEPGCLKNTRACGMQCLLCLEVSACVAATTAQLLSSLLDVRKGPGGDGRVPVAGGW